MFRKFYMICLINLVSQEQKKTLTQKSARSIDWLFSKSAFFWDFYSRVLPSLETWLKAFFLKIISVHIYISTKDYTYKCLLLSYSASVVCFFFLLACLLACLFFPFVWLSYFYCFCLICFLFLVVCTYLCSHRLAFFTETLPQFNKFSRN